MLIATEPKYIYSNLIYLQKNSVIISINANVAGFFQLVLTPDLSNLGGLNPSSQEFDDWYLYQIINNDQLFMNFMYIVSQLRNGRDVILLMYRQSEAIDAMNEALLKFIQVRYGYNYQIVDDANSIDYYDQSTFTTEGIMQFDQDYQRYQAILIKYDLLNTNEIIDESHV